jgi:hypothetical protein
MGKGPRKKQHEPHANNIQTTANKKIKLAAAITALPLRDRSLGIG